MARLRPTSPRYRNPYALAQTPELTDFWTDQIRRLGRNLFFVETGFVLASFEPSKRAVAEALLKELVAGRLITSTFVMTEVVRRIVKSKHREFLGPNGEQSVDLAIHVLFNWLTENRVTIIYPPECVYQEATRLLRECRELGCDLTDVLSFVLVRGLEQNRILSHDGHFRSLGLTTMLVFS
jgi:predicted nucleic acid-binding protein